jgi:hypothetical protein
MILRVALLAALAVYAGVAQTITGSVTGTVTDTTGAVMPGVKITATNTATAMTFPAETNAAGVYNILFLPVGDYTVSAERAGFKKAVLGPFKLEVNQIARADIRMEVGDLSQAVEVTAFAPILQTESTATGDTITSTKLTSLPLNGRNFASLLILIPGAISTNPALMSASARLQGSGSRPQVNGNREQTNNFLLDGVDVNDSLNNRIGYQPSVDALEEVKVLTGNAGAEFGNVGGASVMMTLKSGTNHWHGNAFEFLRNEKFDANGLFANRVGAKRTALRRNIFGGTLGGPIRRNAAFFFIDYEGTEERSSGPATANVAPAAWRTGDLSQFLTQNQIVRDPLTGASLPERQPFAGNIIPRARITNPVATTLFSSPDLYPLPNNPGVGALGVIGDYMSSTRSQLSNHQADAKMDWRPSEKDNISGRWSIGRYENFGSQASLPVLLTSGTSGAITSAVVNWTRSFTARLVNDARIAYSRIGTDENLPVDWSGKLGADGNARFGIPGGQPMPGLSAMNIGGGLTNIGNLAAIYQTVDNKYQAQTNFTFQSGAHLLKFGGQIVRFQQNSYYAGTNGALGRFAFSGGYSGIDYGDFLLNTLSTKGRGAVTGKWGQRHWRNAVFAQDDWKLKRNLTLNIGLRWEYISPLWEVADRQVNINTVTGALVYPGKTEYGRALYKPYRKQFMPTVGLAWTPEALKSKLVIRAGYRFSTFLEGTGVGLRLPLNPPFFVESEITYDVRTPGDIRTGFSDVIARGDLTGPRTGANPYYTARAWEFNLRPQFTNQWNFALESQLSPSTSVSAAYVGQRGTHLIVPREANQPLPGTGPFSSWAQANERRPLARALPNVGNLSLTESSGTMNYHSLQVSGRRRFSHGLEFIASYTLSKTLSDNLGYFGCGGVSSEGAYWQNANDRHGNFGSACFDARHNFTTGGLYEFPFGKGRKYGSSWPRVAGLFLGGWNVNYGLSAHSGFPVTVMALAHATNTGQGVRGNVRPNRYRVLKISTQTIDRWFGPLDATTFCASGVDNGVCAYGVPALGSFGSAGVGTERAPKFFNLDGSIGKKFHLREPHYLDFRAEFFNVLNHVSYGAPGRDITTPATFGQITSQIGAPRNIQFGLKYYF